MLHFLNKQKSRININQKYGNEKEYRRIISKYEEVSK